MCVDVCALMANMSQRRSSRPLLVPIKQCADHCAMLRDTVLRGCAEFRESTWCRLALDIPARPEEVRLRSGLAD